MNSQKTHLSKIKNLVRFMKEAGVAEFTLDGLTVKFMSKGMMPITMGGEEGQAMPDNDLRQLQTSLLAHADSDEEQQKNLMWSAGG